jgi:hypothetical protein
MAQNQFEKKPDRQKEKQRRCKFEGKAKDVGLMTWNTKNKERKRE